MADRSISVQPDLSAEAAERIRQHYEAGRPWFVDPERFDEAIAKRDREYIRRLKELYWSKRDSPLVPSLHT